MIFFACPPTVIEQSKSLVTKRASGSVAPEGSTYAPYPKGTIEDATMALAVVATPAAIILFSPAESRPSAHSRPSRNGTAVFSHPPPDDTHVQQADSLSRTYVPAGSADPDKPQRGASPEDWILRYLETCTRGGPPCWFAKEERAMADSHLARSCSASPLHSRCSSQTRHARSGSTHPSKASNTPQVTSPVRRSD